MKIQERSFSSKILRPKPIIHQEDDGSLIVIATAWGQPEHAQRAVDEIIKYVSAAKSDVEVTSPFEFLTCYTDEVNYVRIAASIANDMLYRGENKMEYFSGVELLVLFRRGSQLAWAHVGCPSLLIQRRGQSLQPLSIGLDLSSDKLGDKGSLCPPLPAQLLGLDPTCDISCGHTRVDEGDQLVLHSGVQLASLLWVSRFEKQDLGTLTKSLIQENPDSPFWLGVVEISE